MDSEMVRFHPYIHMRKGRQLCILIFVEFVGTLGCFCLFVCFCQRSLLGDTETYSSPKYFLLHEHSLEESLAMTSNSPLMSLLEMLKYESNHSPIASLPQDTDPSNRAQGISSFPDQHTQSIAPPLSISTMPSHVLVLVHQHKYCANKQYNHLHVPGLQELLPNPTQTSSLFLSL